MFDFQNDPLSLPEVMPLLPMRDIVIFPSMILPLFVGREASITAVDEALAKDRLIFLVAQKNEQDEDPIPDGIYKTGCIAIIMRMHKLPDGRVKILTQGLAKAQITDVFKRQNTVFTKVKRISDEISPRPAAESDAILRNIKTTCEKIIAHGKVLSPDIMALIEELQDPAKLSDLIASNLRLKVNEAQELLEMNNPIARLAKVSEFLHRELEILEMQVRIENQAKEGISKTQKEYFLREQMKAIKSELGDSDDKTEELEELQNRAQNAKLSKEAREEVMKQLKRLESMHADSAEASMTRTYIDWILELPWKDASNDNLIINKAKKILDEDHYNLEKIKERILEYLSVCKLKKKMKGQILCFVGPPGVGKTSLGKSIARAMNRSFIRMSLGGIKDEAEIRGHRRTYVGSMPGRIIQGIKLAKTNNPVFMLDEIDKLGSDFKGDPSSALLEVLDPEQNNSFRDHYLNIGFDLSKVMFIATANLVDPIPAALKDRMEIMYLSGYSLEEKINIALRFLLPKQLEENGLEHEELSLTPKALSYIVQYYTKEAGLRNFEREIAAVFRKTARLKAQGKTYPKKIDIREVKKYLGAEKAVGEDKLKENQVGIATGLAWTQYGGEILHIETSVTEGKRGLTLTGQLGEVMKESAFAALSYIKARAKNYNIDSKIFEKIDIHTHVPAGAIPKDGPSAGITMATSLLSAITGRKINKDIAMTGEITLRGRILPVGGIKEKVLAAMRAKLSTVILPLANKNDVQEISLEYRKKLTIIFADTVEEIFQYVFEEKLEVHKNIRKKFKKTKRRKQFKEITI